MSAPGIKSIFTIRDVLRIDRDPSTNAILLQTGDVTRSDIANDAQDGAEMWGLPGIVSLPTLPVAKDDAAQGVFLARGDRDIALALRDVRFLEKMGVLKPGEICIFASGEDGNGQGSVFLKQDGSINLMTKENNDPSGTDMGVFVLPNTNTIALQNAKGFGILVNDDGITLTTKKASIVLKEDGTINITSSDGPVCVDGTTIGLGNPAQLVPTVNNAIIGASGQTGVPSTKVFIQS
jgi:hypothetical protein